MNDFGDGYGRVTPKYLILVQRVKVPSVTKIRAINSRTEIYLKICELLLFVMDNRSSRDIDVYAHRYGNTYVYFAMNIFKILYFLFLTAILLFNACLFTRARLRRHFRSRSIELRLSLRPGSDGDNA